MNANDQGNHLYEELSRLNNELVNLQRETFKKNIEVARLAAIVESSNDAISSSDLNGVIVSWNAAAERLYGRSKAEILGKQTAALALSSGSDLFAAGLERLQRGEKIEPIDVVYPFKDGSQRHISLTFSRLYDSLGHLTGFSCFGRDITAAKQADQALQEANAELNEANRRLHILATEDSLTGLRNHRVFQEQLEAEVRRALRYAHPLALIMLDVDHFKQYNDTYGHPEGDTVLKRVGSLLRRAVRDADIAARYGGEEFALILPQTDLNHALLTAERIRAAIASAPWERRAITVSIGVCVLSKEVAAPSDLIACADQALYRSKNDGRNRVTSDCSASAATLPLDIGAP